MQKLKIIFSIIILFSFIVNFANSPLPPPYYSYHVSGNVECDSIINKSNYAIALFGKNMNFQQEFIILNGMLTDREKPVSLTDSLGRYFIVVNSPYLFDSLKIGWVRPQMPVLFSEPYFVDTTRLIKVTKTYQTGSGCSCGSSVELTETRTRIVRYDYNLTDTRVNVCK